MKNFIVPPVANYICENCGQEVIGGRYHNHCPHCLYSKHVDNLIPGDRSSDCQGLMEPITIEQKKGKLRIVHRCLKCHKLAIVDTSPDDNIDLVIQLSVHQ